MVEKYRPWFVLAMLMFVFGMVFATPQWATDWLMRPQFVQACIYGAHGSVEDNNLLKVCNAEYKRFRIVQANNFRPT